MVEILNEVISLTMSMRLKVDKCEALTRLTVIDLYGFWPGAG